MLDLIQLDSIPSMIRAQAGICRVEGKTHIVTPSPEWQDAITSIVGNPGRVAVIGSADVGKTTFCLQLLNAGIQAGVKTALVDADVGQSEVGPPGTIGLAEPADPIDTLSDLPVKRMYFVGATSPVGNLLHCVVGVQKMVDEARSRGAELTVVDTTGLVRGVIARKLKTSKIDLLSPLHLVAIQRGHEVDPLISMFSKIEKLTIHNLKVSPLARLKSPEHRAARRRLRYVKHFEGAEPHIIRLDDVTCWESWLNTGSLLSWQRIRVLERILRQRILHAEAIGNGFYIVVGRSPGGGSVSELEVELRTKDVTIVPGSAFTNVYVGLADARANLLDVGIIQAIDFQQRYVSVITKLKTISPVRVIHFGAMRVKPDGSELMKIRPGEL